MEALCDVCCHFFGFLALKLCTKSLKTKKNKVTNVLSTLSIQVPCTRMDATVLHLVSYKLCCMWELPIAIRNGSLSQLHADPPCPWLQRTTHSPIQSGVDVASRCLRVLELGGVIYFSVNTFRAALYPDIGHLTSRFRTDCIEIRHWPGYGRFGWRCRWWCAIVASCTT